MAKISNYLQSSKHFAGKTKSGGLGPAEPVRLNMNSKDT